MQRIQAVHGRDSLVICMVVAFSCASAFVDSTLPMQACLKRALLCRVHQMQIRRFVTCEFPQSSGSGCCPSHTLVGSDIYRGSASAAQLITVKTARLQRARVVSQSWGALLTCKMAPCLGSCTGSSAGAPQRLSSQLPCAPSKPTHDMHGTLWPVNRRGNLHGSLLTACPLFT